MRNGKPRQVLEKKKTMKQKRLNGIDAAKGLAIMMVVLGHCADKNGPDRVLLHFSMFTGVGVFFLLSGATFCWRDGTFPWFDQRPFRFLTKSLWRSLILPYFIWGSISVVIYGLLGRYAAAELSSDRHHFDIGPNLSFKHPAACYSGTPGAVLLCSVISSLPVESRSPLIWERQPTGRHH